MTKVLRTTVPIIAVTLLLALGLAVAQDNQQPQNGGVQFGNGWTAVYYNNTSASGSAVFSSANIGQVNFNFGQGSPNPNVINNDNFSIRFNSLEPFQTGTYRFTARANDGVRVIIDGTPIIDAFGQSPNDADNLYTADVAITEGTRDVTVEFVEFTGNALIQVFWEAVSVLDPNAPTPTPTNTALPAIPPGALTATVIRAGVLNTRDAPSTGGNVVRRILRGQTYQVVGRDPDARWFLLELGGVQAWAYGYYLFINGNEFNPPIRSAATVFGIPPGFTDTGVLVQTCAVMKLRAQPNVFAEQTGRITWGEFLPVTARTPAGDWYQVLWKGTIGWMFSGFTWLRQGDYANIPIVQAEGASNNVRNAPPLSECTTGSNSGN